MRRAANRDHGHSAIVAALRKAGCSVASWGTDGAPDLVVGRAQVTYLLEVKDPIGPKGGTSRDGQQLNDRQLRWHRNWNGHVDVVRSVQEALEAVGIHREGFRS